MNNNNRLKNALTQNWLRGNKNVYRIWNPSHTQSVLTNRNSLYKFIESNRVPYLQQLHRLITRVNQQLGQINRYMELPHGTGNRFPNAFFKTSRNASAMTNFYRRTRPLNNYVFTRKGINQRDTIRNPIYGGPLMLKNITANNLSVANQRNVRQKRRNETRANAARVSNMMRRVRNNAAAREAQRVAQNTRARQHHPVNIWYDTANQRLYNSNGQNYGSLNIPPPYHHMEFNMFGHTYGGRNANFFDEEDVQRRQNMMNRFGLLNPILFRRY